MITPILKRKMDGGGYKQYELQKTVTTVGRSSSCDVVVNDTSLSRLHLRLENRNDRFYLIDNNSSNGTYLNRRKITEALLKDGDSFMTGRIHFDFTQASEHTGDVTQPLSLVDAPQVSSTVSVPVSELPSGSSFEFEAMKKLQMPPSIDDEDTRSGLAQGAKETVPTPRAPVPPRNDAPPAFGPPDATVDMPMSGMIASPARRLIAVILDGGIGVALSLPGIIVGLLGMPTLSMLLTLLGGVAAFLHIVIGWLKYGKTLGKHLMGIQIIEEAVPAQQGLSPKTLIMRVLGGILCAIPFMLLFHAVLVDKEGRGIHDKIAGTRVNAS